MSTRLYGQDAGKPGAGPEQPSESADGETVDAEFEENGKS
jgi:hypothetical protein